MHIILLLQEPIFSDCICIAENLFSMNVSKGVSTPSQLLANSTAVAGRCPQNCNTLGLWLFLIAIVVFLIFVLRIPTLVITIRSVYPYLDHNNYIYYSR